MVGIDHLAEFAHANLAKAFVFCEKNVIHAVGYGVEIVGNHEDGSIVFLYGILKGKLGIGVQMAGWLVQKEKVGICSGNLRKLEEIFLAAGQVSYRAVDQFFLKAVGFQVADDLGVGVKACILEVL